MVRIAPGGTVPRVQGKAVVQVPLLETNVNPEGVAFATVTPAALLGPLLVTEIVNTKLVPGVTLAGTTLVNSRSAVPSTTGVTTETELLAVTGSAVAALTDAVFVMGFGPA
jgi:hypothetical protein